MTITEAISLLNTTAPAKLSAEQYEALRSCVERNPTIYGLAGGREKVERYLTEAAEAIATQADAELVTQESSRPQVRRKSPSPRQGLRALTELAVLLLVLGGVCFAAYWHFLGKRDSRPQLAALNANEAGTDARTGGPSRKSADDKFARGGEARAVEKRDGGENAVSTPGVCRAMPLPDEMKPRNPWRGWQILASEKAGVAPQAHWDTSDPTNPRASIELVTGGDAVVFQSALRVEPERAWLGMRIVPAADIPVAGRLQVHAEGQILAETVLGQDKLDVPLVVSLEPFAGRTICMQVVYRPATAEEAVRWLELGPIDRRAENNWATLTPLEATADSGTALHILPDSSVLAKGEGASPETYTIKAQIAPADATAIRLEALPHASLPEGGPGRGPRGQFTIARFEIEQDKPGPQQATLPGRYVRVELPGEQRTLMLAEVQVFSGGQNVAEGKPATQSSTLFGAAAAKAVDGYTRGVFKQQSVTHTSKEANPWWGVDLRGEYPIERIALWSREMPYGAEMQPFRLVVTNEAKAVVWQHDETRIPEPDLSYGPFGSGSQWIGLSHVVASSSRGNMAPDQMIQHGISSGGWSPDLQQIRTAAVVFSLAGPVPRDEEPVSFRIRHAGGGSLGRFRLSITRDPPPSQVEPPAIALGRGGER